MKDVDLTPQAGNAGPSPLKGEGMNEVVERPRSGSRTRTVTLRVTADEQRRREDLLATEEPLEIRLAAGGSERAVAVTMRTPGDDWDLAAGFAYGEGLLRSRDQLHGIRYCADDQRYNVVTLDLRSRSLPDLAALARHGSISSACGVCGKTELDHLERRGLTEVPPGGRVTAGVLRGLPDRLREEQAVFDDTGGLHAAAWFGADGELICLREDVGRHNAMDKLVGWGLREDRLPLADGVVLLSGRASFELVQKAVAAGVRCLAAISAPSSLAVDTARRFGVTLVGFLRGEQFNVYSHPERIGGSDGWG